ncbi:MAG: acyltransferase family protein [Myxococcales bacterium]|nr:acyltransferase [Myxococcales bacterium]HIK85634.1 acyltransferase [Myxococcales bacterium]
MTHLKSTPQLTEQTGPTSTPARHLPALDGIRGMAILGILLFHAGHLRGGWLGVDLFFVLSGFLITNLLLAEYERTGRISLSRFWVRRARRLLPALLFFLVGVAAYAAWLATPEELSGIRRDGYATLFYVANWISIIDGTDYWDLFSAASPLEHCWSLAIEEQFYLFFPVFVSLLFGVFGSSGRRILGRSVFVGAAASAMLMAALFVPGESTARVYFGTDTRIFALLLGAGLAVGLQSQIASRTYPSSPRIFEWMGIAAVGLQAWAWFSLDGDDPRVYHGLLFSLAIAATLTIASAILAPRGLVARCFEVRSIRGLGLISYGAYLWHWPLFIVLDADRTALDGWWLTALRFVATLGITLVSYFLLERPIRQGWPAGRRAIAMGLMATIGVAALLGAATQSRQGSFDLEPQAFDGQIDALMVGDSLTLNFRKAFRQEAMRRGGSTSVMGQVGCTQLRSDRLLLPRGAIFEIRGCELFHQKWRAWAIKNHPRQVLLVDGWPGGGQKDIAGSWHSTCDAEYASAYASDLADTIEFLLRQSIEPVILTIPPPWVEDMEGPFLYLMDLPVDEIDVALRRSTDCHNRVRRRVADDGGVAIVDMEAWICPDGACRREIDGRVLRLDGIHFSLESAPLVSNWILDQLERSP